MSFKYLALTLGVAAAFPTIKVKENGVDMTLFMVGQNNMKQGDSEIDVKFNGRAYLTKEDKVDGQYYSPSLLGGSLEYDVNLSQSGCSCDAAVYLTKMPALDANGKEFPGPDGYYYCDANGISGEFCPNFDIMESNTYTFQTIPKKCDDPKNGHYSKCDGKGQCHLKTQQIDKKAYGPGVGYTINTLAPFHVRIEFGFSSYKVMLS